MVVWKSTGLPHDAIYQLNEWFVPLRLRGFPDFNDITAYKTAIKSPTRKNQLSSLTVYDNSKYHTTVTIVNIIQQRRS